MYLFSCISDSIVSSLRNYLYKYVSNLNYAFLNTFTCKYSRPDQYIQTAKLPEKDVAVRKLNRPFGQRDHKNFTGWLICILVHIFFTAHMKNLIAKTIQNERSNFDNCFWQKIFWWCIGLCSQTFITLIAAPAFRTLRIVIVKWFFNGTTVVT